MDDVQTEKISESLLERLGEVGLLERGNQKDIRSGLVVFDALRGIIRDKEYARIIGIGDDFIPDKGLYNALGTIYPALNLEQKKIALGAYLHQFDRVNYIHVQNNHTPYIREPSLLADIGAARPLYWPGLHDEEKLWKDKSFSEMREEIMDENGLFKLDKVNSDFLVAYALMIPNFTDFGEEYLQIAHPDFLERVLRGIVTLRFTRANSREDIEKGRNRLCELLPESMHDRIETLRKEEQERIFWLKEASR